MGELIVPNVPDELLTAQRLQTGINSIEHEADRVMAADEIMNALEDIDFRNEFLQISCAIAYGMEPRLLADDHNEEELWSLGRLRLAGICEGIRYFERAPLFGELCLTFAGPSLLVGGRVEPTELKVLTPVMAVEALN